MKTLLKYLETTSSLLWNMQWEPSAPSQSEHARNHRCIHRSWRNCLQIRPIWKTRSWRNEMSTFPRTSWHSTFFQKLKFQVLISVRVKVRMKHTLAGTLDRALVQDSSTVFSSHRTGRHMSKQSRLLRKNSNQRSSTCTRSHLSTHPDRRRSRTRVVRYRWRLCGYLALRTSSSDRIISGIFSTKWEVVSMHPSTVAMLTCLPEVVSLLEERVRNDT